MTQTGGVREQGAERHVGTYLRKIRSEERHAYSRPRVCLSREEEEVQFVPCNVKINAGSVVVGKRKGNSLENRLRCEDNIKIYPQRVTLGERGGTELTYRHHASFI